MFGSSVPSVSKQFANLADHCQLRIALRYWAVDTWDINEVAQIFVDGVKVFEDLRFEGNGADANACNYEWLTYPGAFYGNTHCYKDIELFVPHTLTSVTIKIGATLDSPNTDESWGFSALVIGLRL
jgi:hypothetical protein